MRKDEVKKDGGKERGAYSDTMNSAEKLKQRLMIMAIKKQEER